MDLQWQYKRGQGVIYVMCHYRMAVWGRGLHKELWYVVDGNVVTLNCMGQSKWWLIVYWIVMKNKSYELTRLDWVGIRLNQFEIFEERFKLLSR